MEIKLHTIAIREVVDGYTNNEEEGVMGYGGRLNIRPKYQREFVYQQKQQDAVIETIFKAFPLNVMYWIENEDGTYEVLDGQQRTISFCEYYNGNFSVRVNERLAAFHNLTASEKEDFLDYPLQIYICGKGTDKERLDWFKIINIAGERLTEQELRNAIYTGQWLTAAKQKFSKTNCVAKGLAEKLMSGKPIRQDYLETVLRWVADADGIGGGEAIEAYMAQHQHDKNADREWQYFQKVVAWTRALFPNYRSEMKGLPWGLLYNKYKDDEHSATELEERIVALMADDDVTSKKGIYEYLLSGEERHLSIRAFSESMKRAAYERQKGICPVCKKHFDIKEMEGDHITPWSQGGRTTAENLKMLCKDCNRRKSDK